MAGRLKRRTRIIQKDVQSTKQAGQSTGSETDILYQQAKELAKKGYNNQAKTILKSLLATSPDHAPALHELGRIYWANNNKEKAIQHISKAHNIDPLCLPYVLDLSNIFLKLKDYDNAIAFQIKLIELDPHGYSRYHDLGSIYFELGRFKEAKKAFEIALEMKPDSKETHSLYATVCYRLGEYKKADKHNKKALSLDPGYAPAIWNTSILYMEALGQLTKGLEFYERGIEINRRKPNRRFSVPRWDGKSDISDKTLLIWREQGIGDEIRFSAFIHDFINQAKSTIIECDARLVPLLQRTFPTAKVCQESDWANNPTYDKLRNDIDCHVQFGSLRYYSFLKHNKLVIPDRYIESKPTLVKQFQNKIRPLGEGLKIGICWRSHLLTPLRQTVYGQIKDWSELLNIPDTHFISLQYDDCTQEIEHAKAITGKTIHQIEGIDLKNDMDASFALTDALDLVITAPTATCEIAAALGKPTWRVVNFGYSRECQPVKNPFDQNTVINFSKHIDTPWQTHLRQISTYLAEYISNGSITTKPYLY